MLPTQEYEDWMGPHPTSRRAARQPDYAVVSATDAWGMPYRQHPQSPDALVTPMTSFAISDSVLMPHQASHAQVSAAPTHTMPPYSTTPCMHMHAPINSLHTIHQKCPPSARHRTPSLEQELYDAQVLQEMLGLPDADVSVCQQPLMTMAMATMTTMSTSRAIEAPMPQTLNPAPVSYPSYESATSFTSLHVGCDPPSLQTRNPTRPSGARLPRMSRVCVVEGCTKGVRSRGLCKAHGGGKRCRIPGCSTSDQGGGLCVLHGGGKRCYIEGCVKSAQWRGLCKQHGGARKCKFAGCTRNGQVKLGYCRVHLPSAEDEAAAMQKKATVRTSNKASAIV